MNFRLAPYRVLAHNGRNWYILLLSDGRLQLDFGPFALALNQDDFSLMHGLAEAAMQNDSVTAGCIAHAGVERSIWLDQTYGALLLAFDNVVLRFMPQELLVFAQLCREASQKLNLTPVPLPLAFDNN
ncbi:MAG: hypothetical protein NZ699_18915 [Roseiflexus sp.]|nr:hypothetical protein [Roseiflexus sp.]MCS7291194.1 hypothetical protein [Roseiflexus sp.]MDW8145624.1 hypothetical protein [Roseiflexaceae bacterium]